MLEKLGVLQAHIGFWNESILSISCYVEVLYVILCDCNARFIFLSRAFNWFRALSIMMLWSCSLVSFFEIVVFFISSSLFYKSNFKILTICKSCRSILRTVDLHVVHRFCVWLCRRLCFCVVFSVDFFNFKRNSVIEDILADGLLFFKFSLMDGE